MTQHKTKQALYGWTDYPIEELGDILGNKAPVRPIRIIAYDRDKMVHGFVKNIPVRIKSGYCYRKPGRIGEVPVISHANLCALNEMKDDPS